MDYLLIIALVITFAVSMVMAVDYENYKDKAEFKDSLNIIKVETLQDSVEYYKLQADSLKSTISKMLSIKDTPVKPTFKMNSYLGEMYSAMKSSGIKCPEGMFALASHETGRFTSRLSKYHNHFGLAYTKHPLVIDKVWSEGDGHFKAVFASDEDCFRYMKLWQAKKKQLKLTSNEGFIKSLKAVNYAASPFHGQIVMQCYHDLFQNSDVDKEMEREAAKNKFLFASL